MGKKKSKKSDDGLIAANKKARYEFHILEKFEAGIVLQGSEVKSLRDGGATIAESYAKIRSNELFLVDAHIPPFKQASVFNHEPTRPRKLLMRRVQLRKLQKQISRQGLTLVPMRLYFNKRGLVKIQLGLGKGKKLYDKREDLKQKSDRREMRSRSYR